MKTIPMPKILNMEFQRTQNIVFPSPVIVKTRNRASRKLDGRL